MTTTNLGMTIPTVGADADTWGGELNTDLGLIDAFAGSLMPQAEVTLASATTTDIGAATSTAVAITGTTTITSFGSAANRIRFVRFLGALTLTHNATSLILLGGANRATAAGDCGVYRSDGSGNWREMSYSAGAYNPGAHTGSGSYAHATGPQFTAPFLGAATASSLALGGATLGGDSLAVNGSVRMLGDVTCAHVLTNGSGGNYQATGFGLVCNYSFNGITATDSGFGAVINCVAHTGGVTLSQGSTSWAAISERSKKKDLQDIPGDPFSIIVGHSVKLGRYLQDTCNSPLKPFLFYEDAIVNFPYATDTHNERILIDPRTGNEKTIPAFKGLSLEKYVPLLVLAFQKQIILNAELMDRIVVLEGRGDLVCATERGRTLA